MLNFEVKSSKNVKILTFFAPLKCQIPNFGCVLHLCLIFNVYNSNKNNFGDVFGFTHEIQTWTIFMKTLKSVHYFLWRTSSIFSKFYSIHFIIDHLQCYGNSCRYHCDTNIYISYDLICLFSFHIFNALVYLEGEFWTKNNKILTRLNCDEFEYRQSIDFFYFVELNFGSMVTSASAGSRIICFTRWITSLMVKIFAVRVV